jgi:hypothetical protein
VRDFILFISWQIQTELEGDFNKLTLQLQQKGI